MDEKRERHMRKIETAIAAYRCQYEVRVVSRSHRLQQKMIDQQEKALKLQEDQLTLQGLLANNLEVLSKGIHQPESELTADLAGSLDLPQRRVLQLLTGLLALHRG
jgi:response regulator of citrate/malate metabolism